MTSLGKRLVNCFFKSVGRIQREVNAGASLGVSAGTVATDQFFAREMQQGLGDRRLLELTAAAGGDHLFSGRALHQGGAVLAGAVLRPGLEFVGRNVAEKAFQSDPQDAVVE